MAKRKPRTLDVGPDGTVRLPLDALEAIGWEAGEKIEIRIDSRRRQVQLERFVDDPWSEALKDRGQKGFEDILSEQTKREQDAKELFERKLREDRK